MYKQYKITLCLPCRNEAENLARVISKIPKFVDEIIIISNRSTDNSVALAKSLGLKVIEDDRTMKGIGYGYAHITGIKAASGDIIIGADCDTTYPLANLETIIKNMLNKQLDFVSCSRYPLRRDTNIPLRLRAGVYLLNLETRLLYGIRVSDILSGMWLLRRSIVNNLQLTQGDWNLSPEIKINAAVSPCIKFGEYNIQQYRRRGKSHQAYLKTGWSHFVFIFKNWFFDQLLRRTSTKEVMPTETTFLE